MSRVPNSNLENKINLSATLGDWRSESDVDKNVTLETFFLEKNMVITFFSVWKLIIFKTFEKSTPFEKKDQQHPLYQQ